MKVLRQIAFIFALIDTILLGFALLPLAWCIPMTVATYNAWKEDRPASIALGVCMLIFCSPVAGVLLLIDTVMSEEERKEPKTVEAESTPVDGSED